MKRREYGYDLTTSDPKRHDNGLDHLFDEVLGGDDSTNQLHTKFISLKSIINKLMGNLGREQFLGLVESFGLQEAVNIYREKNDTDSRILKLALPLFEAVKINVNDVLICSLEHCARDCISTLKKLSQKELVNFRPYQNLFIDLLDIPYLNWIPLTLLDLLPLPQDLSPYFRVLDDKKAMEICSLKIKQNLWIQKPENFRGVFEPHIENYSRHPILNQMINQAYYQRPEDTGTRFSNMELLELVSLIDPHPPLYDQVCSSIQQRFLQTGNVIYCNLMFDLLLAFKRHNSTAIINHDPLYKLVWCLSAINLNEYDILKKVKNIVGVIQELHRSEKAKNMTSVGMIFRASFVIEWAVSEIFRFIWEGSGDFSDFHILCDILHNGLEARLKLKDHIPWISSNNLPSFNNFIAIMRKIKIETDYFTEMSDNRKDYYYKGPTYKHDKTPKEIPKQLYQAIKQSPPNTLVYMHFILDRIDKLDFCSLKGAFSVMKHVILYHSEALELPNNSWFLDDNYDPYNPSIEPSFVSKLGTNDFFFPFIQTICHQFKDSRRLILFITNENFFHALVKFLSDISLKYDSAHREALVTINYMQNAVKDPKVLAPSQVAICQSRILQFTEALSQSYHAKLITFRTQDKLRIKYSTIFKKQQIYSNFRFNEVDHPNLMKVINFIQTNPVT